jgi:thiol-disulfide isomerase/thioredoxin
LRAGANANPYPAAGRPAEIGRPESAPPAPPYHQVQPTHPENIAQDSLARNTPPVADIPNPAAGGPAGGLVSGPPTGAPFCSLVGQTLYNFSLYDLSGRPWDYRRDHRGRLTLIDFWGSWCVPCLHAVPHLKDLQQRYGPYGLEVIGIAYEEGNPLEQTQKVNRVRQRLEINYRLLLGGDKTQCPVRSQFGVSGFPTLVLLDEGGRIVWRSTGLDATQVRDLDIIIRQRLGAR